VSSAAILTGGRASRFGGRDKASLVVGGRTILTRQVEELIQVTDDILVVGGTAGQGRNAAAAYGGVAVRLVADRVAACGPLGGLDAALAAARDDRVFVVACDMPFVNAGLVSHLLALAETHDVVVPRTERGYHSVCAVYTRACQPIVSRRLAEGALAMTGLFAELRVRTVPAAELERFGDPERLLANVNTPADYHGLETLQDHHG
jgi:molybdopterin-guanine dinucleotide biosynthesis protein A